MKHFIKKNWRNLLFVIALVLLILPQTRMPIQVFIHRLISFSPSEIDYEERQILTDYQWNLSSLFSESVNLNSSEGKVILINYWATWCPPCVAEMPELQMLYDDYKDQIDFYFVSSEAPEKLKNFLNVKGYDLPVYIQMENSPEVLSTRSLPTTFIISKEGEIVIRKSGAADWNSDSVRTLFDDLLK